MPSRTRILRTPLMTAPSAQQRDVADADEGLPDLAAKAGQGQARADHAGGCPVGAPVELRIPLPVDGDDRHAEKGREMAVARVVGDHGAGFVEVGRQFPISWNTGVSKRLPGIFRQRSWFAGATTIFGSSPCVCSVRHSLRKARGGQSFFCGQAESGLMMMRRDGAGTAGPLAASASRCASAVLGPCVSACIRV